MNIRVECYSGHKADERPVKFWLGVTARERIAPCVRVTLEIEAEIPRGTPENVVRTVAENARTLKFNSQGFESE
jgi:hypothetical protein